MSTLRSYLVFLEKVFEQCCVRSLLLLFAKCKQVVKNPAPVILSINSCMSSLVELN